jgi:hypothetical protein
MKSREKVMSIGLAANEAELPTTPQTRTVATKTAKRQPIFLRIEPPFPSVEDKLIWKTISHPAEIFLKSLSGHSALTWSYSIR